MLERLRRGLTYANVMATIAVFGVLAGGGAWAASRIGSKDIAKNAIHSKQIKRHAVTHAKLAPGAVHLVMRQGPTVMVADNDFEPAEASCRSGERATGGGLYNESNVFYLKVTSSYPTPNPTSPPPTGDGKVPTGWRVWVANNEPPPGTTQPVNAYVICASR